MERIHFYLEHSEESGNQWKVRKINGIEQSEWLQGPGYVSLDAFCDEEAKRGGWRHGGVDYGENDAFVSFLR